MTEQLALSFDTLHPLNRWTPPECSCRPGWRCPPCARVSRASSRMFRLCRLWGPDARRDRVAYADQVTSMNDARTALCIAIGISVDQIDPCTGHDRRPHLGATT